MYICIRRMHRTGIQINTPKGVNVFDVTLSEFITSISEIADARDIDNSD